MAGVASILMRAFRVANGSFHTWRAGDYDPTMSDAVGDQAPPFPIGDYSDHVAVAFLEAPLARTDANAYPVPGLGTLGTPVTFPTGSSILETLPGADCRDFTSISYWVNLTTLGTGSLISLFSAWSGEDAPAGIVDFGSLASDDLIASGISPQNAYQADYSMSGGTTVALGPFNVPVRGRRHVLAVRSDTGDVEGYVRAMRFA